MVIRLMCYSGSKGGNRGTLSGVLTKAGAVIIHKTTKEGVPRDEIFRKRRLCFVRGKDTRVATATIIGDIRGCIGLSSRRVIGVLSSGRGGLGLSRGRGRH